LAHIESYHHYAIHKGIKQRLLIAFSNYCNKFTEFSYIYGSNQRVNGYGRPKQSLVSGRNYQSMALQTTETGRKSIEDTGREDV
jgi:hypothetical protein